MISKNKRALGVVMAATGMAFLAGGAQAETFRWATGTDPSTLDPHAQASAPVLGFLNNIYEGLVRRGKDMSLEPALAESWEALGTDGWRFNLRQGVTFHGGEAFDADDVVFSFNRANSEQSDIRSFFASVAEVRKVDDFTVDFLTKTPNPILPDGIANWLIMDQGWTEDNGAATPARDEERYTTLNTNGTAAFKLKSRDPGVRTVLEPFDGWWGTPEHNITEAIYTPITTPATRVAALLSGEVDFVEPVPLQDVPRIKAADGMKVVEGIEARVLMLGFQHESDTLRDSDAANPFQDRRVREAIYHAVDMDTIIDKIMRGQAQAAGLLISPSIKGFKDEFNTRLVYDPDQARALLAEAGYADGFSFSFRCPNDRYINDEAICTAITAMLAAVGLDPQLDAVPVRGYWDELRADQFDMYLLGWSPGTFDAEHIMRFLLSTPDPDRNLGSWNFGAYSNATIDEIYPSIVSEVDQAARQEQIDTVHKAMRDDTAYVPLHVQPLVWATKDNIDLAQRADNFFILRWVTVN